MAFERNWPAVSPRQFTADGGTLGQIQIADSRGFRVGMRATVSAVGKPDLQVQIKRVMSDKIILVGPVGSTYASAEWSNLSAYTLSAGAYLYAGSQEKSKVPANDRDQATFEAEPVVAKRTIMVDQFGRFYDRENPMPISISDGNINVDTLNAEIDVNLTDKDHTNRPHDAVRIGDGNNELKINSDGSVNANVINGLVKTPYDDIALTYNASGDLDTVIYRNAGNIVASFTATYDATGSLTRFKPT